jgi:hypothetical protein
VLSRVVTLSDCACAQKFDEFARNSVVSDR